jgi:hypothetical protein
VAKKENEMKVYVVMVAGSVARIYSNRKAASQHVKLVRETKQEALDACGINPGQVFYVTHTAEKVTQ